MAIFDNINGSLQKKYNALNRKMALKLVGSCTNGENTSFPIPSDATEIVVIAGTLDSLYTVTIPTEILTNEVMTFRDGYYFKTTGQSQLIAFHATNEYVKLATCIINDEYHAADALVWVYYR